MIALSKTIGREHLSIADEAVISKLAGIIQKQEEVRELLRAALKQSILKRHGRMTVDNLEALHGQAWREALRRGAS